VFSACPTGTACERPGIALSLLSRREPCIGACIGAWSLSGQRVAAALSVPVLLSTLVCCPANAQRIIVTFTAFDLESGYDFLRVFDVQVLPSTPSPAPSL
jgi:hypothetical protein